jgi:hypothetical protein
MYSRHSIAATPVVACYMMMATLTHVDVNLSSHSVVLRRLHPQRDHFSSAALCTGSTALAPPSPTEYYGAYHVMHHPPEVSVDDAVEDDVEGEIDQQKTVGQYRRLSGTSNRRSDVDGLLS